MSIPALIVGFAGGFVIAGVVVAFRTFKRRRDINRRRLESLGSVESHRQARPDGY